MQKTSGATNMKKILNLILFTAVLISGLTAQNLQHQTEEKTESVVYFTKDVSPQGLVKVYNASYIKVIELSCII